MGKIRQKFKRTSKFHSGFENEFAEYLRGLGIEFEYEKESYVFVRRVYKTFCSACGGDNCGQRKVYTPDFFLPEGVIIETKGILDSNTRERHRLIRNQHPGLDIRIVVQQDRTYDAQEKKQKIKKRYSQWAQEEDIKFAVFNPHRGTPTKEWLTTGRWA